MATDDIQNHQGQKKKGGTLGRLIFAAITLLCFGYLYFRLNGAALREGLTLTAYMVQVFANVQWVLLRSKGHTSRAAKDELRDAKGRLITSVYL